MAVFFYMYEIHKNGHFRILVSVGCFFPFRAVLKSHYPERGEDSMMSIEFQDSFQQIKSAFEDLQAIPTVIAMVEDHPVYSNYHETLIVVRRALEPIINEMQKSIEIMDGELKNVQ